MPSLQVVNTTRDKPDPTGIEQFFSRLGKDYRDRQDQMEIGNLIGKYQQNRQDANALENLLLDVQTSNKLSPTARLNALENLKATGQLINQRDQVLNARAAHLEATAKREAKEKEKAEEKRLKEEEKKRQELQATDIENQKKVLEKEEKIRQKANLIKAGWPEYQADIYLDAPPGVKQQLAKEHEYLTRYGVRKPLVQVPPGVDQNPPSIDTFVENVEPIPNIPEEAMPSVAETPTNALPIEQKPVFVDEPIPPKQKIDVKKKEPIPEKEWPDPIVPENMPPDQKVKWEDKNEKENNKELKISQDKKKALATNDGLINTMTKIVDAKKLPEGVGKIIIDPNTGDIRPLAQLAGLVNPETQLYVKILKQWLRGAKEYFGGRVTNYDITQYMAQLPNLLNSEQGKRLILKMMKYTNDIESIYNNTLNESLKHYGRKANYNQILKVVDDKVKKNEQETIGRINNLVSAAKHLNRFAENPDKYRGYILMQDPTGKFKAVPKEKVEKLKTKQWRDF